MALPSGRIYHPRAPLILYPAHGQVLVNGGFEAALGAEWVIALTGTGTAARSTVWKKAGAYSLLAQAVGIGTAEFYQQVPVTLFTDTGTDGYYLTGWMNGTSNATGTVLEVKLSWRDGGGALVGSEFSTTFTAAQLASGESLFSAGPFNAGSAIPGGAVYLRATVKITSTAGATTSIYFDELHPSHALDFQDNLAGGTFMTQFDVDSNWVNIVNVAETGKVSGPNLSPPVRYFKTKTSLFDMALKNRAKLFYLAVKKGAQFSIWRNQSDWTNDRTLTGVIRQDNDGVEAQQGTQFYTLGLELSEEPGTESAARDGFVVEMRNMIGGTASLYFSTGGITGIPGSAQNVLPFLDSTKLNIADQMIDDLASSTEFPPLNFSVLDHGQQVTALFVANLRTAFKSAVILWDGQGSSDFTAFKRRWIGFLDSPDQVSFDDSGVSFTLTAMSQFERLKQPITPITGGVQLNEAVSISGAGQFRCKQPAGVLGTPINLIATSAPDVSSFESGSDGATPGGWTSPDGTPKLFKQAAAGGNAHTGTRVLANTATGPSTVWYEVYIEYPLVKLGATYQGQVFIMSQDGGDSKYELIIEGRTSGGTVIVSKSTGILLHPEAKILRPGLPSEIVRNFWEQHGEAITVEDSSIVTVRFRIRSQLNSGGDFLPQFDSASLKPAVIVQWDREVAAVGEYIRSGRAAGTVNIAQRGAYGSLPMNHNASNTDPPKGENGDELTLFVGMRGHPLDIARRLITTSLRVAKGAWSGVTAYVANSYSVAGVRLGADSVTYGGSEWRCLLNNTNQTPAEGAYWTKVGRYDLGDGFGLGDQFPDWMINHDVWDYERNWKSADYTNKFRGYDFSAYRMDFRVNAKVDSLLEMLTAEFLKPLYANLYQDESGLLCIRLHRAIESIGAAWSGATAYLAGDVATISGNSWRCILAHTNQSPSESIYWTSSTLAKDDLYNSGSMFKHTFSLDKVVNEIVAQYDYDVAGSVDVEENQTNGGSKFMSQVTFNEFLFGHEPSDAQTTSAALYGRRSIDLAARSVRGISSYRMGVGDNLGGDQLMWETCRRIITRRRHPSTVYTGVPVDWTKRMLAATGIVQVTSDAMVNLYGGAGTYRKRVAVPMQIMRRALDVGAGHLSLDLEAVTDVADIPNTAPPADAMPTPTANDFQICIRNWATLTYPDPLYFLGRNASQEPGWDQIGMGYLPMPVWPVKAANIIWVTLFSGLGYSPVLSINATASTDVPVAPSPSGLKHVKIYAAHMIFNTPLAWVSTATYAIGDLVLSATKYWRSLTAHTDAVAPVEGGIWTEEIATAADYQAACIIPYGGTDGYFVAPSCTSYPGKVARTFVRIAYVNTDEVEGTRSTWRARTMPNTVVNFVRRWPTKVYQVNTSDRASDIPNVGGGNRY